MTTKRTTATRICRAVAVACLSLTAVSAGAGDASAHPQRPPLPGAAMLDPHDLAGIWMQARGRPFRKFPLTPPYQAILDQRLADAAAGHPFQVPKDTCLPAGLFGTMTTGAYPIEIFQQKGGKEILFQKEIIGALYRVYLNRPHKSDDDLRPLFYGDSVGHWEGDVLVVDTISLGGSESLDLIGTPHSDALHVIQRLRRVSYDTLEDTITAEDPKAFTEPITGTVTFKLRPDLELDEYECTNERNVVTPSGTSTIVASPETNAPAVAPKK
jgi:hypothetical protein